MSHRIVRCPTSSCGHPINAHSVAGCHNPDGVSACFCTVTPNDIAYALVFGELTQSPAVVIPGPEPIERDWS